MLCSIRVNPSPLLVYVNNLVFVVELISLEIHEEQSLIDQKYQVLLPIELMERIFFEMDYILSTGLSILQHSVIEKNLFHPVVRPINWHLKRKRWIIRITLFLILTIQKFWCPILDSWLHLH